MWDVEYQYIEIWLDAQDTQTIAYVFAALELLQEEGPNLGRPIVDAVHSSHIKNLKELRPASPGRSEIRILFAFDPLRRAVMLFAGNKAEGKNGQRKWNNWYKKAIPKAEAIYQQHLQTLGDNNG